MLILYYLTGHCFDEVMCYYPGHRSTTALKNSNPQSVLFTVFDGTIGNQRLGTEANYKVISENVSTPQPTLHCKHGLWKPIHKGKRTGVSN